MGIDDRVKGVEGKVQDVHGDVHDISFKIRNFRHVWQGGWDQCVEYSMHLACVFQLRALVGDAPTRLTRSASKRHRKLESCDEPHVLARKCLALPAHFPKLTRLHPNHILIVLYFIKYGAFTVCHGNPLIAQFSASSVPEKYLVSSVCLFPFQPISLSSLYRTQHEFSTLCDFGPHLKTPLSSPPSHYFL
jgi:hypothetical protein